MTTISRSGALLRALLLGLLLAGIADAQAQFKQLAGPPTEFAAMAAADPASSATHSRSALLPVQLEQTSPGQWTWRSEIPIEDDRLRLLVLSGVSATDPNPWRVTLRDPADASAPVDRIAVERRAVPFGPPGNDLPADYFEFGALPPGNRSLSIESNAPGRGFVLIEGAGPARLLSRQVALNQRVGQRIGLVARLYDRDAGVQARGGSVGAALLRVTAPDGQVVTSAMFDDGLHQDGEPGDGAYGGDFLADRPGAFNAQVVVTGQDRAGSGFVRTTQHLIPILEERLNVRGAVATGEATDGRRLAVGIDVSAPEPSGHYRAYAEVWGSAESGAGAVPVAWIGGMSAIRDGALVLGLDTRWIAKSGARAPFELRNVRIEDPDHFITLASAERMPLPMPELPVTGVRSGEIAVDEAMLMGPRPDGLAPAGSAAIEDPAYTSGTGHKLLLVHGYCSSDVWGPNVSQFTHAGADSVFLDLGQNRSHDAFAQLVLNFGLPWNSYAIVAHSQGGAAALHLYTHYWSGLDNAGPGRLIQSVGTPYQGTPLADSLALLGQLFGFGCGVNYDLTYGGAAAWLAGIPTFYRAAVNHYTTSFTEHPLQYDYCNIVTDLFLTDPEDGVTEQARGQLPGGVDQGHTTGQCHTTGMRDPPQYDDGARNGVMNASAAVAPVAAPPLLQGAVSVKLHGQAGPFGLPLSLLPASPTIEPRSDGASGAHSVVFSFDKAVTGGVAAVTAGPGTVGVPTFDGPDMTVPLTGVTDAHYVTVTVGKVTAADGGTGGSGSVRIGFLAGDANQNRAVTLSDLLGVNAVLAQPVSAASFLRDVNASGTLSLSDVLFVNARLTQALPAP